MQAPKIVCGVSEGFLDDVLCQGKMTKFWSAFWPRLSVMDLLQFTFLAGGEQFLIPATVICVAFVVVCAIRFHRQQSRASAGYSSPILSFSTCPNPDCIRCRRYQQVQQSALKRMPWVVQQVQSEFGSQLESLDRIIESIRHPLQFCTAYQAPTVLMVRDLPSREVVTEFHRQAMVGTPLQAQHSQLVDILLEEISQVPFHSWQLNDTPNSSDGSWEVLSLLNQGSWDIALRDQCPRLVQFIRALPNLLDGCLFGNVLVSKIYAGTCIEPHCGPSNVRHRLQYTLQVPTVTSSSTNVPFLRVGGGRGMQLTWKDPGEYFIFDDSMIHSVQYQDDEGRCASPRPFRMVLIVDLWHPLLTPGERALLRYMYPPFSSNDMDKKLD